MKSLACCFFLRSLPLPAVVAAWAMFTGLASAEKLIIQNGSFDAGKKYWKGDGEVVTLKEDGNRVGQIEADERRLKHLSIEFEMGDLTVLEIRFRARFLGGAGRVRLKIETGSGAVMNGYDLPPDGSWKDLTMTYDRKPGIKKFYAVFQALLGKGVVQIDDVWAGAPGTAPTDPRSTVIIPAKPTTPPVKPVPMEKAVAKTANQPSAPIPLPEIVGSLEQILDAAPEPALLKLADPATAVQGVDELNAFIASQVRGKPAVLVFQIIDSQPPPDGLNKVRIRDQNGPVKAKRATLPVRQVWAYFPAETAPELSQVPVGREVRVQGVLGRCDVKMTPEGPRLNVDLRQSRLAAP